ncbi:hypothetical protein DYB30_003298 [Aphanomyces astaci]|uniref:Calponin-homology (CH) domain-containing protein n=1 Tax=Aphanomyces astaci TaxID=112090 RepID=A0A397C7A8_APHAT|nr:hypothetical protein DYB30_003298 [Aphanomyces astaci]
MRSIIFASNMPRAQPPSLELTYFDAGGRAEPIRLILAYGGIDFDDVRIPGKEFPEKKPSLDLPFGQVPTLKVNGTKVFAQSVAISRYAATLAGLYPQDPLEALEADLVVDTVVEATMTFVNAALLEPDEAKKADKLADANNKILPRLLGGLEKRVVGPYFLGEAPTFADIYVLDFHTQIWSAFPDQLMATPDKYPKLAAIADHLRQSSELSSYLNPKKRNRGPHANHRGKVNRFKQLHSHDRQRPALGMIMVGDRQDSRLYVEAKGRACAEVGIRAENRFFAQSTTQAEILRQVHAFNADPTIDGILIQMPLPATIDEKTVVDAVLPTKDVDGLHPYNVGELAMRRRTPYFTACTPEGIVEMLDQEAVPIAGRVAVVLGRSDLVGNPVGMLLRKRHATVISCHSQTTQVLPFYPNCRLFFVLIRKYRSIIENLVRQADIVVSACGVPQFVRGEWLKPGCVVIDVGINFVGNDMVGDVCFNEALGIASAITPVPGGAKPPPHHHPHAPVQPKDEVGIMYPFANVADDDGSMQRIMWNKWHDQYATDAVDDNFTSFALYLLDENTRKLTDSSVHQVGVEKMQRVIDGTTKTWKRKVQRLLFYNWAYMVQRRRRIRTSANYQAMLSVTAESLGRKDIQLGDAATRMKELQVQVDQLTSINSQLVARIHELEAANRSIRAGNTDGGGAVPVRALFEPIDTIAAPTSPDAEDDAKLNRLLLESLFAMARMVESSVIQSSSDVMDSLRHQTDGQELRELSELMFKQSTLYGKQQPQQHTHHDHHTIQNLLTKPIDVVLLNWMRLQLDRSTATTRPQDKVVRNFSEDLADGHRFALLLHHLYPKAYDATVVGEIDVDTRLQHIERFNRECPLEHAMDATLPVVVTAESIAGHKSPENVVFVAMLFGMHQYVRRFDKSLM